MKYCNANARGAAQHVASQLVTGRPDEEITPCRAALGQGMAAGEAVQDGRQLLFPCRAQFQDEAAVPGRCCCHGSGATRVFLRASPHGSGMCRPQASEPWDVRAAFIMQCSLIVDHFLNLICCPVFTVPLRRQPDAQITRSMDEM